MAAQSQSRSSTTRITANTIDYIPKIIAIEFRNFIQYIKAFVVEGNSLSIE